MPPPTPDDDASAVRRNGWRQGSIAGADLIEALRPNGSEPPIENSRLIVVSHDCDVVNLSFEKEPRVEAIWALPVGTADGNLTRGKNSRLLQLEIPNLGGRAIELAASDRFALDRRLLAEFSPGGALELSQKRLLGSWLAKRYDRAALPDAFNRRLPQKSLKRTLERGANHIRELFVAIVDEELADDAVYEIALRAVMGVDDFENTQRRTEAQACLDELVGHLGQVAGIEILSEALLSEAEITLDDIRSLKRWDFDWMSFPRGD